MKKFSIITIALLISLLGLTSTDLKAGAVGNGSEATCDNASNADTDPGDDGSDTPFVFNFDAGAGNTVSGVCIKSGNNMFGDSHSGMLGNGSFENGCYTVSGVGTQFLTVTRNNSGNTCQDISHLDIDVDTTVTPTDVTPTDVTPTDVTPTDVTPTEVTPTDVTPTETITPTEKPSVTPHPTNPCEGASCNTGGNSPTPSEAVTPSVSAAPTTEVTTTPGQNGATSTPTPTTTTSGATNPTATPGVGGVSTQQPTQERVLGASTMAATGNLTATVMNMLGFMGSLLIGLGFLTGREMTTKK